MSENNHADPRAIRAKLDYPVIDSDGHWLEFRPAIIDYMKKVCGNSAIEGLKSRDDSVARILTLTPEQRRDERRAQEAWWAAPTKNTRDRATAMIPKLLYERMEELGLDFTVLYPTSGMGLPFISNDEVRRAACRGFNMYLADAFGEFSDRMTPAALIPMNTPEEAVDELEHVVKTLGLKAILMGSMIRRPIPAYNRNGERQRMASWYDVFGLDSEYNYDPVWAKCVELKVAPTFHRGTRGMGFRVSPTNFTYNHIGHFAAAGETVCKALFLGGVTRRFPTLKFAFLEGGVGWACQLYADLIGHWKKRNAKALEEVNPRNLNRKELRELFERYKGKDFAAMLDEWRPASRAEEALAELGAKDPSAIDDYAACGITRASEIRDLFVKNFYFGCEADDPINAWGFNSKINPYGARLKMLLGSDIGHFDVPDMRGVMVEAYEMVEDGLISESDFRDFVFTWPTDFWAGTNPDFFKGTAVEEQTNTLLSESNSPA